MSSHFRSRHIQSFMPISMSDRTIGRLFSLSDETPGLPCRDSSGLAGSQPRGAQQSDGRMPYGGWLLTPRDAPTGYGITRRRLDPILRELAAETPGVETFLGVLDRSLDRSR